MVGVRRATNAATADNTTSAAEIPGVGGQFRRSVADTKSLIDLKMTGLGAVQSTPDAVSASPSVWRKTSHPPLHTNNSETRNKNLQLQLKNRGTKDDWGASIRYDCEDTVAPKLTPPLVADHAAPPAVSPSVYERFMMLSNNLTSLMRAIMDEAKRNTDAESCSLFLINEEKRELVAKVFDNAGDNVNELCVPFGDGVVGRVAETRTLMNIRDAHKCPFFYAHVDELTGYRTKNILCFPIIDNSGVLVAVAELCNKHGEAGFTRKDERYAKSFALYCANSISHSLFYKKIQEITTRSHMACEMIVQGAETNIACDDVLRLVNDPRRDWRYFSDSFGEFYFAPRAIGVNHFHKASMMFFEDLDFTSRFRMSKRRLACFVLRVSAGYRRVPYHNWSHAFAVAHFCWLVLRTQVGRTALNELERLSLLIACLCHDIDHRGTTNSFQLQSKTPLAQLYSSEGSVLERHHYAQTVAILGMAECDILSSLNGGQYRTVMSHIREVILATDIAAHLKKAPRIQEMVQDGYSPTSLNHRYLLTCLIMTASDLSDQSKNFHNAKLIAESIYKEFFAQGDLETELGVKPLEMMDREKAFVPQVQLDFLESIGLPVFRMLADIIPESKTTYEAITANHVCWKALKEEMSNDNQQRRGVDYLRDEQVEQRVYQRVRQMDPRIAEIASRHPEEGRANLAVEENDDEDDDDPYNIYDGYVAQDQENDALLMPKKHRLDNNNQDQSVTSLQLTSNQQQQQQQQEQRRKARKNQRYEASSDSSDDNQSGEASSSSTPRRIWRRARHYIETMSSTCVGACSSPRRRSDN